MELGKYLRQLFEQRDKGPDVKHLPSAGESTPGEPTPSGEPTPGEPTSSESALPIATNPTLIPSRDAEDEQYQKVKRQVHMAIVARLDPDELNRLPEARRRLELKAALDKLLNAGNYPLGPIDQKRVIDELLDDMLGFGPIEPLLRDPMVGDILINGTWGMYVEYNGVLREVPNPFLDGDYLTDLARRIAARVGRTVSEGNPMVDARLPDGSRVHIALPPVALNGPLISIRRFSAKPLGLPELLARRALTVEMSAFLEAAVKARLNIIVSGGTGSGKTTLLNALSRYIPDNERIVTIEDAAELQLQQRHVCRMESHAANVDGKGEVTIRELVRNSLRMRPDRIVIGECRGSEALDMLQAMNTGHDGSITTLHANTPRDALARIETMVMMAGLDLPLAAIRQQIASGINLIVHVERLPGGARRVTRLTEVVGMERDVITTQDLFVFNQTGVDAGSRAFGRFESTGLLSHFDLRLKTSGSTLPPDLFRQRILLEV